MRTFTIFWLDGHTSTVEGRDACDAVSDMSDDTLVNEVDFFAQEDRTDWWKYNGKNWEKTPKHPQYRR